MEDRIRKCITSHLPVAVIIFVCVVFAVSYSNGQLTQVNHVSGVVINSRSRHFSCRCHWSKNEMANFEVPLEDFVLGDNMTQESNCSLPHFGIIDFQDGEWICRTIKKVEESHGNKNIGNEIVRQIIDHPQTPYVKLGGYATFRCKFSTSAKWCFWTRDGMMIAIEGRYEFLGDVNNGDCSIGISNVSLEDDGQWICQYPKTSQQEEMKSEAAYFTVFVTPTFPIISLNGMQLKNDQKIFLFGRKDDDDSEFVRIDSAISCWSFNGNPAATLRWSSPPARLDVYNNPYRLSASNFREIDTNSIYPKLRNSRLDLSTFSINSDWHQANLTCEATHPGIPHSQKYSTSVQIILAIQNDY